MAALQKKLKCYWFFIILGALSLLLNYPTFADSTYVKPQKRFADTLVLATDSLSIDTLDDENAHINPTYVNYKPVPTPQPLYSLYFRQTILDGLQIDSCVGNEQRQLLYNWLECDTTYYLTQYTGYNLQPKRQRQPSDALLFGFLMLLVVVFTVIKHLSENFWARVTEAFANINLAKQFFEEQLNYQSALPNTLIYAAVSLLGAIWAFLLLRYFKQVPWLSDAQLILVLWGVSGTYFVFRQLMLRITAFILLPLNNLIGFYSFNLTINNILIAAVLTPLAFLFAFGHKAVVTYWLIYVLIGTLVLSYLYNIYRTWQITEDIAMSYKFHYLLYLCALEILPILVLIKIAHNNLVG